MVCRVDVSFSFEGVTKKEDDFITEVIKKGALNVSNSPKIPVVLVEEKNRNMFFICEFRDKFEEYERIGILSKINRPLRTNIRVKGKLCFYEITADFGHFDRNTFVNLCSILSYKAKNESKKFLNLVAKCKPKYIHAYISVGRGIKTEYFSDSEAINRKEVGIIVDFGKKGKVYFSVDAKGNAYANTNLLRDEKLKSLLESHY